MNTPKFKKGDWIKSKKNGHIAQILMLLKTCYDLRLADGDSWCLDYDFQDNWELTDAPPKNKLEKAAEEYADEEMMSGLAERAFIAGAKWMRSQMPMPEDTVIFMKGVAEGRRLEKDEHRLTWEDMAKIDAIILDVNNEFAVDYSKEIDRQKFYEEVLRRFKQL